MVWSLAGRPGNERLETQDFRPPDERELIVSSHSGTVDEPFYVSDVCGIDRATGRITSYTRTREQYDEAESMFPDGRHILVESDRHGASCWWTSRRGNARCGNVSGLLPERPVTRPYGSP